MYTSSEREPLIKGHKDYATITNDITAPMAGKPGKLWYMGIGMSTIAILLGSLAIFATVWFGIGTCWLESFCVFFYIVFCVLEVSIF